MRDHGQELLLSLHADLQVFDLLQPAGTAHMLKL